jgi:recombination protein RecR
MSASPLLQKLIEAFQCLPGIGPRSSQRLAYHLLKQDRNNANYLADMLKKAVTEIQHCEECRTFSETKICCFCQDPKRANHILCIVETPLDQSIIEQNSHYQGRYFVLLGHLSPLDGIGPEQIGLDLLKKRFETRTIEEIILATNTTVEGETTAHFIAKLASKYQIRISRLACGIPIGGELEYVDSNTLTRAFNDRFILEDN